MEKIAKLYYEEQKYITKIKLHAEKVKEEREKIIRKYIPLSSITNLLELGCGSGILKTLHPNWIGLDVSRTALKRARPSNVIVCDVQNIPIRDGAVNAIISFDIMEHVQNPEQVLEECHRILSQDGVLLSQEAWFCEYAHRQSSAYSKIIIVIRRIIRELKRFAGVRQIKLEFRRVEPDYTKVDEDWDAVSSIDPHAMLCWFESRGYFPLNKQEEVPQRCIRKKPFKSGDAAVVVKKAGRYKIKGSH